MIVIKVAVGWSFNDVAKSINLDDLMNTFAEMKPEKSQDQLNISH